MLAESKVEPLEKRRRPLAVRLAPFILVALLVGAAVWVSSIPNPGRRTTTDTSVDVYIGASEPSGKAAYPIVLLEGGDPAHEVDHILQPLMGIEGIASATLDWSSGVLLTVEFDPEAISAQQIAGLLQESGYLAPEQ